MMKTIPKLLVLAVLATISWATAQAQDAYATQTATKNVTHPKSWYEQFSYNWPINTTTNSSKITDKATDPDQIIALLRYIYMEKRIPGIYYAGYGTNNNNLNLRVRPVYYGGIAGGWNIPYNNSNNRYTDYETYKPNEEGYTVLLVAVRDNFTMDGRTQELFYNMDYAKLRSILATSVEYVQLLTDGMRLNENLHGEDGYYPGTLFTLENAAGLNRFFFLSKGQARDQYNADRGDADINAPFGRMFEQFSPTDGTQGSEITNYYESLKTGESYKIQHDCNSVLIAEHYFSMAGKNATGPDTHQDVSGLQFFIPDQRLTYFESTDDIWVLRQKHGFLNVGFLSWVEYNYVCSKESVTFDGRIMNYDQGTWLGDNDEYFGTNGRIYSEVYFGDGTSYLNRTNYSSVDAYTGNAHNGGYTEYAFYHMDKYAPKTQWYRIELTATPVQDTQDDFWGEHTYRIDLAWQSSADKLSYHPLEQTFWVYEIIDGEEVLISPEEGITKETWTVEDCPGTKQNPNGLYTEQYPNGRKRTFVVKGRPTIATYQPIRSNPADAVIPGYDKHERLSLSIGTDYYSKWDAQGQYNQYGNYVLIENGTGNTVTKSLINADTKFRMWRTWIDEAGHEQTIEFADVNFGDWTGSGTDAKVHYTVTYLNNSQKGSVPEKAPSTSGEFGILNNQDEVDFGYFEVMDVFQASTVNNTHPDHYTYVVTFQSAVDFEIDALDEHGNLIFDEDENGDYYLDEQTQEYHKIVDDAYAGTRYKVRTVMTNAVTSNKEIIPVFKSTYSLFNEGYTQAQINNDNDHNMGNLLAPHMSYDDEGNVTTNLNKIKVNLEDDATSAIHQYSIYRNPQETGGDNNVMIAHAQAGADGYLVSQNDAHNSNVERGTFNPGDYVFEDEAILLLGAQSVAYVPVISTRPKDEERLTAGDYNTYGADIKRVGIPTLELGQVKAEQSTYTWQRSDGNTYRYYQIELPVEATLPDLAKYAPYYWRSWRNLSNTDIFGEEYLDLECNRAGGFMYEQTLPDEHTAITSGAMLVNYGTLHNLGNVARDNVTAPSGTFGAQSGVEFDVDFKIRFYYLVKDVANRAPSKVKDESTSPTGTFYVVEYNKTQRVDSNIITEIEGVGADRQVQSVTYYNTLGLPSTTPWTGVNIVVTRYADGTQSTAKVVR